jgi:hypothetical protein
LKRISPRGWLAFGLAASAVGWALALVAASFAAPAYQGAECGRGDGCTSSSATLFAVNGWWVVELLCGVVLVAVLAFWALHRRCATESRTAANVATSCIVVLAAFSWLTGFSIGLFVFPVAVLLTASALLVPASGRAGPT